MAAKTGKPPLPPWGSAVAGATGAVLANALVYPLDMFVNVLLTGIVQVINAFS